MYTGSDYGLSDSDLDRLELEIPALAIEATNRACERALAAGLEVCVARGTDIVMLNVAGVARKIGSVPPKCRVKTGVTYTVARGARVDR